jgi:hypothetical protein
MIECIVYVPLLPLAGYSLYNLELFHILPILFIGLGIGIFIQRFHVIVKWLIFAIGFIGFVIIPHDYNVLTIAIILLTYYHGLQSNGEWRPTPFFISIITHLFSFLSYLNLLIYEYNMPFLYTSSAISLLIMIYMLQREQLLELSYHSRFLNREVIRNNLVYIAVIFGIIILLSTMMWSTIGTSITQPIKNKLTDVAEVTIVKVSLTYVPGYYRSGDYKLLFDLPKEDKPNSWNVVLLIATISLTILAMVAVCGLIVYLFFRSTWKEMLRWWSRRGRKKIVIPAYREFKRSLLSEETMTTDTRSFTPIQFQKLTDEQWRQLGIEEKIRYLCRAIVQAQVIEGFPLQSSDSWEELMARLKEWIVRSDVHTNVINLNMDLVPSYHIVRYALQDDNSITWTNEQLDGIFRTMI